MARFIIEIETVDATPAEWVDALAKVRGLPAFELSEEPRVLADVEAAAGRTAVACLVAATDAAAAARRCAGQPSAQVQAEAAKALVCSAYSAMRLVGGAK